MAKFCQNCGTPYEEGAVFCASCGNNLAGGAAPKAPKAKKTAITLAGLQEIASKRMKAIMIIVLVVTLLTGLAVIGGCYDVIVTKLEDGDIVSVGEGPAHSLYYHDSAKYVNGTHTALIVLNIIYGVALLSAAVLTIIAMLENACGGNGSKFLKLAVLIALGSTFLVAILFLILCRGSKRDDTYIIEVPIRFWFNLALFGGISALVLPEKKA